MRRFDRNVLALAALVASLFLAPAAAYALYCYADSIGVTEKDGVLTYDFMSGYYRYSYTDHYTWYCSGGDGPCTICAKDYIYLQGGTIALSYTSDSYNAESCAAFFAYALDVQWSIYPLEEGKTYTLKHSTRPGLNCADVNGWTFSGETTIGPCGNPP